MLPACLMNMKPTAYSCKSMLAAVLALLLASCATTPEERRANAEREAARLKENYGQTCERLGYQAETDKWRDCLLEMESQRLIQQQMMMDRMNWYYPGFYSPYYYAPLCHRHGSRTVCH
jgi:hypothetical protein